MKDLDTSTPPTKGPFTLRQAANGGWMIEKCVPNPGMMPEIVGSYTDDEDMIDGLERLIGPTDAELEAMDQAWEADNEAYLAEERAEWDAEESAERAEMEAEWAEENMRDTVKDAVAEAFQVWMSYPAAPQPEEVPNPQSADEIREKERDEFFKVLRAIDTGPREAEARAEEVKVRKVFVSRNPDPFETA